MPEQINWRDFWTIFFAVLVAEIVVLVAQGFWPMLAERVRVQQEAWGNFPFGTPTQVSEQDKEAA